MKVRFFDRTINIDKSANDIRSDMIRKGYREGFEWWFIKTKKKLRGGKLWN